MSKSEPYPFDQQWFKDLSLTDKCKWLVADAHNRPPLEFKVIAIEKPVATESVYVVPPSFDAPQNPPTPIALNAEAKSFLLDVLRQNLEWEIALPTFRAYRIGTNTRHSAFSLISLAHAQALGFDAQETDKVIIDEHDNKYQFHYSNLHDALRWAFGSDNPVVPDGLGYPLTSLRDLLCMTKKANKRSKLKFAEVIGLLERL
jgi:hypothetical protein